MDEYLDGLGQYKIAVSPVDTLQWGTNKPSKQQQSMIQDSMAFDVQQMRLIQEARQELETHGADAMDGIGSDPGSPTVQLVTPLASETIPTAALRLWLRADAGVELTTWNLGTTAIEVTVAAPHANMTGRYERGNPYQGGSLSNATGATGAIYGLEDVENGAYYLPGIHQFLQDNSANIFGYYIPDTYDFTTTGWIPCPSYVTRRTLLGGDASYNGNYTRAFTGQTGEDAQVFTGPNGNTIAYNDNEEYWYIYDSNGNAAYRATVDGQHQVWYNCEFAPVEYLVQFNISGLTNPEEEEPEAFMNGTYVRTYQQAQNNEYTQFTNTNAQAHIAFDDNEGQWKIYKTNNNVPYYVTEDIYGGVWEQVVGDQYPTITSTVSSIATQAFTSVFQAGSSNYTGTPSFANATAGQINYVSAWTDQSNQHLDAHTNGSAETSDMQLQSISGNNFVTFGLYPDSYSQLVGFYGTPPLTSFPCTIITVANWPGALAGAEYPQVMYTQTGLRLQRGVQLTWSSYSSKILFTNGIVVSGQTTVNANRNYIYTASVSANNNTNVYLNGNLEAYASKCGGISFAQSPYYGIGQNGNNKGLRIAEVIVYNRTLTNSEFTAVHAYLAQKYAIT